MKLKSPNHVRYRLYVRLCGMEQILTSKWSVLASGAKNITIYFKLTRLCGNFWPSWSILQLVNKIKMVVILADNQRFGLGIVISSKRMIWAYFRQRPRKICTDHCFAKTIYSAIANSYLLQTDKFLCPLIHSDHFLFSSNKF